MDPSGAQAAPQQTAHQLHMQRFCPENVAHNAKQLYYIRSITTSAAGSAAGVLGLVNLSGFYLYLASILVTNSIVFLVNVRSRPQKYLLSFNPVEVDSSNLSNSRHAATPSPPSQTSSLARARLYINFLFEGTQEMAFGYVLWWTLWTALIHVFD